MSKKPTFEDAIADLKNVTMWNLSDHFPLLLAGLQNLAERIQVLEAKAKQK